MEERSDREGEEQESPSLWHVLSPSRPLSSIPSPSLWLPPQPLFVSLPVVKYLTKWIVFCLAGLSCSVFPQAWLGDGKFAAISRKQLGSLLNLTNYV